MKFLAVPFGCVILMSSVLAQSGPEIRKEIKEQNGRKVEYMYIDGCLLYTSDAADD